MEPKAKKEQKLVDDWNKTHTPETAVTVRLDDGTQRKTKTRSHAELLGGHTAVVWLEGITGCYLLSRVSPR